MGYRSIIHYQTLVAPAVTMTTTTAQSLFVTDPNMRFEVYEVSWQLVSVTGFSLVPTAGMGVTSPNYVDQVAAIALTGITTAGQTRITAAGGAAATSIAPGTTVFSKCSTAATATTYIMRIMMKGVYY